MKSIRRVFSGIFSGKIAFILSYMAVCLAYGALVFFLWKDEMFQRLMMETLERTLFWAIAVPFGMGLLISFVLFINTVREAGVVESLVRSSEKINLKEGNLPLKERYGKSMIVKHVQRFALIYSQGWSSGAEEGLLNYLETVVFKSTNKIKIINCLLPSLGLLGTVLGIYEVCVSQAAETSLQAGLAHAIGTTALGVLGMVILMALNELVILERTELIDAALVVIGRAEEKEEGSADEKHTKE